MTERQRKILSLIIQEYIKTAKPIASGYLVDNFDLKVSPATVRNEMSVLTKQGYLIQPHLSAGRIPTREAFSYYIENLLPLEEVKNLEKQLKNLFRKKKKIDLKKIAKQTAELAGLLTIVASGNNYFYYTGLSYLFSQPEFSHLDLISHASEIIDRLDELISIGFGYNNDKLNILIGDEKILGGVYTLIFSCCYYPRLKRKIFFGLFGPIRMNYRKNIALINCVNKILSC